MSSTIGCGWGNEFPQRKKTSQHLQEYERIQYFPHSERFVEACWNGVLSARIPENTVGTAGMK